MVPFAIAFVSSVVFVLWDKNTGNSSCCWRMITRNSCSWITLPTSLMRIIFPSFNNSVRINPKSHSPYQHCCYSTSRLSKQLVRILGISIVLAAIVAVTPYIGPDFGIQNLVVTLRQAFASVSIWPWCTKWLWEDWWDSSRPWWWPLVLPMRLIPTWTNARWKNSASATPRILVTEQESHKILGTRRDLATGKESQ